MTNKHTPGPWYVDDYGDVQSNGEDVACVLIRNGAEELNANARLISAAPDLLSVLQELSECAEYWSEYDVPLGIVDRIKAAIAKATGEGHG